MWFISGMLLTRDKWSSRNLKYWEMVEILGRYICLCSQEVINNAASERSHGKGAQWSLSSGRRGIKRNLIHWGFPPRNWLRIRDYEGGPKEQNRSLILVALNVDPAMLCVHIVFGHISSIFFSLFLFSFPFEIQLLSALPPSNEWFFLYYILFLNIYNFCFLLTSDCFVRS